MDSLEQFYNSFSYCMIAIHGHVTDSPEAFIISYLKSTSVCALIDSCKKGMYYGFLQLHQLKHFLGFSHHKKECMANKFIWVPAPMC